MTIPKEVINKVKFMESGMVNSEHGIFIVDAEEEEVLYMQDTGAVSTYIFDDIRRYK